MGWMLITVQLDVESKVQLPLDVESQSPIGGCWVKTTACRVIHLIFFDGGGVP